MKITNEVILNVPRPKVWEVFDNPDNMQKWQPTLKEFELQTGEPGQPGSRSKLTYVDGGREVVLIETITSRNEPDNFSGTYDSGSTVNTITNTFVEMGPDQTKWIMESDFEFGGLMRWLAPLMRGSIQKRTEEDMLRFKELAESYDTA